MMLNLSTCNLTPFGTATQSSSFSTGKVAIRMDGFKLYVTNTSTIPPDGYLCYEDPDPGFPNITQTISCNQLGKFVIYYDEKGSDEGENVPEPIVELCYVAVKGCLKGRWGTMCEKKCTTECIDCHCHPGNGSCVWGYDSHNCLNNTCDINAGSCTEACSIGQDKQYCNKCNIACTTFV
ncbi:unnamed protein product [Mytilus coruscus]|uniref:MEGF10_11 n=1 Tax=Mytilus coruscus TaxID=42192 RepID=A0A6J8BEB9_MYTCO|nr:unnamed protein product [Mytilus coruscus]